MAWAKRESIRVSRSKGSQCLPGWERQRASSSLGQSLFGLDYSVLNLVLNKSTSVFEAFPAVPTYGNLCKENGLNHSDRGRGVHEKYLSSKMLLGKLQYPAISWYLLPLFDDCHAILAVC